MFCKTIKKKTSPLCFMPDGKIVCYKYGNIFLLSKGKVSNNFVLFDNIKERYLGRFKYAYRLLRLGIRSAIALNNNTIIISINNMLHELNIKTGELSKGYYCGEGIRPLNFTKVKGIESFKDGIYFGGYLGNLGKKPVNVYHRKGLDQWEIVYTFSKGDINHVHSIVPDPYRQCLWIFTGDFDESAAIWKVSDDFRKVERVLCNNQIYRACVIFSMPEGLLYATDAPYANNYIYLMNPESLEVKEVFPLDGSCIYGCQWKNKFVFSSTVEGDGRNMSRLDFYLGHKRGAGIKNDYVHMYIGNMEEGFQEIYKEKKDSLPYYTFQFGVFKFPAGVNNEDALYFQPVATKKNDIRLMAIEL